MQRIDLIAKLIGEKHRATLAHMQYLSVIREYAPGKELYMREVHFLMAVAADGSTASEVAAALEVTQGAVSQLAARLEKKGLILRTKSAQDKRLTLITLTDVGADLQLRHRAYDQQCFTEINELFSSYSDEQIGRMIAYEQLMVTAFSTKMNAQL